MHPTITGASALNETQVGSFLDLTTGASLSSILRDDGGQLYISVTPIAVLAAAVPEPQTWAMMLAGLLGVAGWARRRQRAWER
ncbi:MAG: PEP-CTERM sorting domain-containing protein [Rhodoferax sp.]|nr:PEP-CTERM sorting domain-containing protein [Rhodoferax sp.]MCW5627767.1 PEP-CTERM sorting domain-containing protein [Rhodoferax sp.]